MQIILHTRSRLVWLKFLGGIIVDVVNVEYAIIVKEFGASDVMILEQDPIDIVAQGRGSDE